MTTAASYTQLPKDPTWFGRAENWLDRKGKGAWIAAMVLGFIFFWPVGLALLAYIIWRKSVFQKSCNSSSYFGKNQSVARPTGNAAFDAYKEQTLQRLKEEQENFETYLQRLRDAKDKAEFDQFMNEREKEAKDAQ